MGSSLTVPLWVREPTPRLDIADETRLRVRRCDLRSVSERPPTDGRECQQRRGQGRRGRQEKKHLLGRCGFTEGTQAFTARPCGLVEAISTLQLTNNDERDKTKIEKNSNAPKGEVPLTRMPGVNYAGTRSVTRIP